MGIEEGWAGRDRMRETEMDGWDGIRMRLKSHSHTSKHDSIVGYNRL